MSFTIEKGYGLYELKVDDKYVRKSADFINVKMKSGVVFKKVRLSNVREGTIQISINGYSRCILLCEVKEIEFYDMSK